MIDISIATEDILSEEVISKILTELGDFNLLHKLGRKGCGYLIKKIENFNTLANTGNVLVVIDLDMNRTSDEYLLYLTRNLKNRHENLIFSVPTREVESWILADREGLSNFLNISEKKIDRLPDSLDDPKSKLINLAKACKNSVAKNGIPPKAKSISKVGLSYNTILTKFVTETWSFRRALENSLSLSQTVTLLENLE
ncbi:hypothetical protein ACMV8I_06265 [Ewingella sp. S1.OA.A_B6]